MKKIISIFSLLLMLSVFSLESKAALGEASLMFPASNLIVSKPGHVVLMWSTNVDPMVNPIRLTLNTPDKSNLSLEATLESNEADNDTGESMSNYIYSTLEFDLDQFINETNPNYGKWEITIPAGIVCSQSNPNDKNPKQTIVLEWYKDNASYSAKPSFGSMQQAPSYRPDQLKEVTISWSGTRSLTRNEAVKGACLYRNSSTMDIWIDHLLTVKDNSLVFDFSGFEEGDYRLYMPAGYVYLTPQSGGLIQVNAEISTGNNWFTIFNGMNQGQPLFPFNSSNATVATDIEYIDIEWKGENISLTNTAGPAQLYPNEYKDKGQNVDIPNSNASIITSNGTRSVLRIKFGNTLSNSMFWEAQRVLFVPAGFIKNEAGEPNPAQTIVFKVTNDLVTAPVWNPADNSVMETLKPINLSWPGILYINYNGNAYLLDESGNRTTLRVQNEGAATGQVNAGDLWNPIVTFNFSNLNLKNGKYKIVMPARAFTVDIGDGVTKDTPAMEYNFTLGKQEVIEPEPEIEYTLSINQQNIELEVGETANLTVSIEPKVEGEYNILWYSANNNVATISSDGKVTAIGEGESTITATLNVEGKEAASASSKVTVTKPIEYTVSIEPKELNLLLGEKSKLQISIDPNMEGEFTTQWTSTNESIASVDQNGSVEALGEGSCKITATVTIEGKEIGSAEATVKVTTQEPVYFTSEMNVNPATGTSVVGLGNIEISWDGIELKMEDEDAVSNDISLDYVTVTLNGAINNEWKEYMGASLKVAHTQSSDEQNGGSTITDDGTKLILYLGDMSYFWTGGLQIEIAEGAVESTQGEFSPAISLTYHLLQVTNPDEIIFSVEDGYEFTEGEGEISVSWNLPGQIELNTECDYPISVLLSDDTTDSSGELISMEEETSIEDNALVINVSALPIGKYYLVIPEGFVFIGSDYLNGEVVDFSFSIVSKDDDNGDDNGDDEDDEEDDEEAGLIFTLADSDGILSVYNIQGSLLYNGPAKEIVLVPGVYIINGKKVIVK